MYMEINEIIKIIGTSKTKIVKSIYIGGLLMYKFGPNF